ncbi:MAG: tyrosine-type recombinase/integrase, partial [Anaerolineae bacterium]
MSPEHLTLLKPVPQPSPFRMALDAFLLSREAMRCTPKTLEAYRYALGNFLEHLEAQGVRDPRELSPHHIRTFLVALQRRGLKDTTQHLHARCLKTFLRWLVEEGDLEENPMRRVPMPRLEKRIPPPFSPEEVHRLLEACDRKTPKGLRDYALVLA